MNVLILTPDAVGSTLLQRLLTVYMQLHDFDRPVINLHELTNGLNRYYSPEFNREILGKDFAQGYEQSLPAIVDLLNSVDHYKTARLAEYHIKSRGDSVSDQLSFYEYLNRNYFIISCRRKNLFEHAVSQTFNRITKKLNVYSPGEKLAAFGDIFCRKVDLDTAVVIETLETYKSYLSWCARHFEIGSYFHYEQCMNNLEDYILRQPVFLSQRESKTFKSVYGIEFEDWNRCHFYTSDIGTMALTYGEQLNQKLLSAPVVPDRTSPVNNEFVTAYRELLPAHQVEFYEKNQRAYYNASRSIGHMCHLGILPTGVPIKKQTLAEKLYSVRNLDTVIAAYNAWAADNTDLAQPVDKQSLMATAELEYTVWQQQHSSDLLKLIAP